LQYNNDLAVSVEAMGYKGILAEGVSRLLNGRSPNFIYKAPGTGKIKTLLKNFSMSDDIAFRFSDRKWIGWPLTAEKFATWCHSHAGDSETLNLFMDYETFGEHQWKETGIFEFLQHLPEEILKHPDFSFKTVGETVDAYEARDTYDAP